MTHQQSDNKAGCSATAQAHANIALIKYWGKRSSEKNLPAVGSISLTLDALKTETELHFSEELSTDTLKINGQELTGRPLQRVSAFLDTVFSGAPRPRAEVLSTNNFPTAAGLASSASGFAALALSASKAGGRDLDKKALSRLARKGSGSAARSIYGGFVEMKRGQESSGRDDYAVPLEDEDYWDICLLVAVTSDHKKEVGSTKGMNRTAETSPFYPAWVEMQAADLADMREAVSQKDFEKMGELTEHSCFKMHGLAMSSRPPLLYWNAATVKTIQKVRELRKGGVPAYITMDAGPQVKILCLPKNVNQLKQEISKIEGINQLYTCNPGPAAAIKSRSKKKA